MKTKKLASYLAKKESGKSEGKIGDHRQAVSILSDLIYKHGTPVKRGNRIVGIKCNAVVELYKNGQYRAARKARNK